MNVTDLIAEVRAALQPITDQVLAVPYLDRLDAGSVPQSKLITMAGQQWHIIESDLRSMATMVARYGGSPSRQFFLDCQAVEVGALADLATLATALGVTTDTLAAVEPLPGAFAYPAYVAWLAQRASDAEFAAAFLINLPAWGQNCARIATALQTRYGLSAADVVFFTHFAAPAPAFEAAAQAVIGRGLAAGVPPAAIHRAARLLQAYELAYWEALERDLAT